MKLSDIPDRFNIPFADSAGGGFITYPIPQASQIGVENGRASLTDGFPPLNFQPVGAGGVPPFGQDMNGLLKQVTAWSRWAAGGSAVIYNSSFSTAVGGYPAGAILSSSTAGRAWLCIVDDNTSNPDAGGSGWVGIANIPGTQGGSYNYAVAGGTADALTVTLTPAPTAYAAGLVIRVLTGASANSGAMSVNVNGLGVVALRTHGGNAIVSGQVPAATMLEAVYDGTAFRMMRLLPATVNMAQEGVSTEAALTPGTLFDKKNPYFISSGTGPQNIPVGIDTKITAFPAPSASYFNTGSSFGTSAFTCGAKDAGAWLFISYAALGMLTATSAGNDYRMAIALNGTTGPFSSAFVLESGTYGITTVTPYVLAAGDEIDVRVFQNTDTNRTIGACQFFGMRLGGA